MPVTMTKEEVELYPGILPSDRSRYFKVVDAKSNLAPHSGDTPWYELCNVELPNPEPPIYPNGDRVQAIVRVNLAALNHASHTADDQKVRRAILDVVERGKTIGGQLYPYSPSVAGAHNERALMDDATEAVANATAPRGWRADDLKAITARTIGSMKSEGWLVEEVISSKGRFRRGHGLKVDWSRTPWENTNAKCPSPTGGTADDPSGQLGNPLVI